MRIVAGPEDGAPNFVMRVFEVQPQSSTPYHSHNWEHEVFVLSGSGVVRHAQAETQLSEGDVVLVALNEQHSFINTGEGIFRFICVIPLVDGKLPSMPPAG
ncbi:MAG: cupin domain-containing protein [Dehalococcoidia bacterium]|nr:cupin domain-containing protein [Dehalococcoidia bacterium]